MHTISRKETTKSKNNGGLGLQNLKEMNEACIAKLCWKIKTGDDSLWSKVLCGKYYRKNINKNELHNQMYVQACGNKS